MGKFDGILLCTDLDDTLLTTDKKISPENKRAIEYFKDNGGLFTFATGRVPAGATLILEQILPNAPMVCFNGGSVYDWKNDKMLWSRSLDREAINVVEYIDKMFDFIGIEICAENKIYFSKINRLVKRHQELERLPDNHVDYHDVTEEWKKVLFITETELIPLVRSALASSPFTDNYTFVQSSPHYYELLPKNSNKGEGLMKLAEILGIKKERTVGIGDNENDLMLVKMSGTGIAVANAVEAVKSAADHITKANNNSHAVAEVIYDIESGKIKLD